MRFLQNNVSTTNSQNTHKKLSHHPCSQTFPAQLSPKCTPSRTICTYKFHWLKSYNTILSKLFQTPQLGTNTYYSLIKNYKLDHEKITWCTNSDRYKEYIDMTTDTAHKLFGIQWTPSTVLINMQTRQYIVITGAYAYSTFEEAYLSLTQSS